jgi:hypothetical protein
MGKHQFLVYFSQPFPELRGIVAASLEFELEIKT